MKLVQIFNKVLVEYLSCEKCGLSLNSEVGDIACNPLTPKENRILSIPDFGIEVKASSIFTSEAFVKIETACLSPGRYFMAFPV
jgi:hypothetical protein